MKRGRIILLAVLVIFSFSCSNKELKNNLENELSEVPSWSQEAIWYQIFVERFRNGDPNNDPQLEDILSSYPNKFPDNWQVSPWTNQWYKLNKWEEEFYEEDFYTAVQSRRYGGDLQGVLDKLDYLDSLGITAIYFNPLNYSPSLHKYDATDYAHIDPNFGPDPEGDKKLMLSEDPLDSKTWVWTEADKLFLKVIEKAHERGLKVILDYSWNHTGVDHIFWKDILKNQSKSKYADFYEIEQFDNPETDLNEFKYEGWAGVKGMPELKKVDVIDRPGHGHPYKGNIHPKVKDYIFAVSKRWMDPYNNGDVSKGLDGYRLDVADQIGLDFWRDYRTFIKSINPEAYLVGEIWWEEWPDKLMDPRPYTHGDIFDAVMHYQWYKPARRFFANANGGYSPSEFVKVLEKVFSDYDSGTQKAMMNMSASHDTPRLSTSFFNKNQYKNIDRSSYKFNKPDDKTFSELKQFLVHQYTYIGSPQIWQGDEMGMWGGDDPDDRKPLIWHDFEFEAEDRDAYKKYDFEDEVKADKELIEFYRQLIEIRKNNPELIHGSVDFILVDDENKLLAYKRSLEGSSVYVVFNVGEEKKELKLDVEKENVFTDLLTSKKYDSESSTLTFFLEKKSSVILKIAKDI